MNIFITGGTGFIGTHLISRLVGEGHGIECLVRPTSKTLHLGKLGVKCCPDIPDMGKYDLVIHLAGVLGHRSIPLGAYREAHVELPRRILERMGARQKFIYLSTNCKTMSHRFYQQTKREGEQVVKELAGRYSIVKPDFTYGEGDRHHLPLYRLVERLRVFPMIGGGGNVVTPTYVGDVVDAIVYAMSSNEKVIPVSGRPVTMAGFIRAIAEAMGRRISLVRVPAIRLPLLGEVLRVDFFTHQSYRETYKEGIALEDGLGRTVAWYKRHGLLTKSD